MTIGCCLFIIARCFYTLLKIKINATIIYHVTKRLDLLIETTWIETDSRTEDHGQSQKLNVLCKGLWLSSRLDFGDERKAEI